MQPITIVNGYATSIIKKKYILSAVNRRRMLIGSGVALTSTFAGCTSSFSSDEPEYNEDDHEDLLLSIEAFPEDWNRDDEVNDNFDAVFLNKDETIVVFASVEIDEDIDDAEKRFENAESSTRDPIDYDIGDEAFWDTRNNEIAITVFRHSNAVGQVAAMRQSGMEINPDQSRSQEYARKMYDNWRNI